MQKTAYQFFAIFMAMILFLSSVGVALDTHVCQDKLKSISFLGEAKNCYELAGYSVKSCEHKTTQQQTKAVTKDIQCELKQKDCCNDHFHYFQSDIDFQTQTVELNITPSLQLFLLAYAETFLFLQLFESKLIPYLNYKPPLILRDIPILVQSFLL